MSSCNPPDQSTTVSERAERVRRVIEECMDRRAAGESVADEELIASHPNLMPELKRALGFLQLAANAEKDTGHLTATGLKVRCPHCQNPIEVIEESSISNLACPSCGSQFDLTDDSESTFQLAREEIVNHFRLVERVGVGAFGSVWRALDTQLDRTVALKLPRKGRMGPDDQEQFVREARAAAQLRHRSIVRVLEVGRYKDRIYIASEFIEGLDLAEWLAEHQASPYEAAELCRTMADALQHAHDQGVIHRDMKPSNIMMDDSGEPHLMDFGLAKRESAEMTMTLDGKLLGTPAYMSPEQARGDAHNADSRSDVYSLGVILFELLTGERPFRGTTGMLIQQILVEDAPIPRQLNRSVPPDIETICLKCLEKDPNQRYRSAGELRDDLQRFISGQPVQARPVTRLTRAWRWCKRNPVVSGLAATVASLLIFLAVASSVVAVSQRRQAETQQRLAEEAKDSTTEYQRLLAQRNLKDGIRELDNGYGALGIHLIAAALNEVPAEDTEMKSNITENLRAYSSVVLAPTAIFHHEHPPFDIRYSPDGTKLVTVGGRGEVKLWSANSGELLHNLCGHTDAVFLFRFSPDSGRLITCGHYSDSTARLWSVDTGETLAVLEHEDVVMGVGFHPKRDLLITVTPHWIRYWSGTTFELLSRIEQKDVVQTVNGNCAKFNADGSLLLTTADGGLTSLWSVEKGELLGKPTLRGGNWYSQAFSPDGRQLVTGSHNGEVRMWSTADGKLLWKREHYAKIRNATFDSAGRFVLTTSADGAARIWSAKDGTPQTDPLQHGCWVLAGAFLPDGESFVTVDHNAFIRLWSTKTGKLLARPARFDAYADSNFTNIAIRPDGKRLAICSFATAAFELDVADLQPTNPLCKLECPPDVRGKTKSVAFSSDGRRAISGSWSGTMVLWALETGKPLGTPLDYGRIWDVFPSPTQPHVIVQCGDALRVISIADDQLVEICKLGGPDQAACAAFSPDGRFVVIRGVDGHTARVCATTSWEEVMPPISFSPTGFIRADFSPDGKMIACLCHDGTIRFWSMDTGQFDGQPLRNSESNVDTGMNAIAFSPDGKSVASGGVNKQVITWDFETRMPTGIILRHDGPVKYIAYTANGSRILTATKDGDVYMWSATTGERIGPLISDQDGGGKDVAFDLHRNRFLISTKNGAELRSLPEMTEGPMQNPVRWAQGMTGRKMNPAGTLEWLDRSTWTESKQETAK